MIDVDALRRRLTVMGFALFEVKSGYIIQSVNFPSLRAGTEMSPLTIEQVWLFMGR